MSVGPYIRTRQAPIDGISQNNGHVNTVCEAEQRDRSYKLHSFTCGRVMNMVGTSE